MKWTDYTPYRNYFRNSVNVSKESSDFLKTRAKNVLMSSTTVDQVKTGLKYCELAGATDIEAYKIWKDFLTIIESE
jgi:hypothetical protein